MKTNNMVFVFGSNEAGIHGAGAARYAVVHRGARMGIPFGLVGQSFAIPTKDASIKRTLPMQNIEAYINNFIWQAATEHRDEQFQVTRIGCGLAGLKDADVAPLFKDAPSNCFFDEAWQPFLGDKFKYWGTF